MRILLPICLLFFFLQNTFTQCDQVIDQPIIINEIGSYVEGGGTFHVNAEYIELLVVGEMENPFAKMYLGGYKIDDNNFTALGIGNEPGHIVFSYNFPKVKPGSLILIYNPEGSIIDQSMDGLPNANGIYQVPISSEYLIKCEGFPSNIHDRQYNGCSPPYRGENWDEFIPFRNAGDVAQLRDQSGEYIHAISWWKDTPISYPEQSIEFANTKLNNKSIQFVGDNYNEKASYQVLTQGSPGSPNSAANNILIDKLSSGVNQNQGNLEAEITQFPTNSESNGIISLSLLGIENDARYSVTLNGNQYVAPNGVVQFEGIELDLQGISSGEYEIEIQFEYSECTINTSIVVPDEQVETTEACNGECVTLNSDNVDPNLLYSTPCISWLNSNGDVISQEQTVEVCPEGPEEITQFIENENGVIIQTIIHQVDIESSSYYISSEVPDDCPPSAISLNISGDEYSSILWSTNESTEMISVDDPGNYSVTITSINDCEYVLQTEISDSYFSDSDGDGVCNIEDCAPYNANENIDSDGDGTCDGLDCAPNDPNYFEDFDGDGYCDHEDCQPYNSLIYPGAPCDDKSFCTTNDVYDQSCNCDGTPIDNCDISDCLVGDQCDDGNPCTSNDAITEDCNCQGEQVLGCDDQCEMGTPCDDGDPCTKDDQFGTNCLCAGTFIENCPECESSGPCDDSNPCTINDTLDENCNCRGEETNDLVLTASLGSDCFASIILNVTGGNGEYSWEKNGTTLDYSGSNLHISDSGEYTVISSLDGKCLISKSLDILANSFDPTIEISSTHETICNSEDEVILSIPEHLNSIRWFYEDELIEEEDKPNLSVNVEGVYSVEALNSLGCVLKGKFNLLSDIKSVNIEPKLPILCPSGSITLMLANSSNFESFEWSTGETTPSISVSETGDYSVSVFNSEGCISIDKVKVESEENTKIDDILIKSLFYKQRVLINDIIPTLKGGEQGGTRSSDLVNVEYVNDYQITRIELNPQGGQISLNKFAGEQVEDYYCYEQNTAGLILDKFCPDTEEGYTLDEFINYSNESGNFSYFIKKAEIGEETDLYIKFPFQIKAVKEELNHGDIFKKVFFSILCNKENGYDTNLFEESKAIFKIYNFSSDPIDPVITTEEESVDYVMSGPIRLPNNSVQSGGLWTSHYFGKDYWYPSKKRRDGMLMSNYRHGGKLLTSNPNSITAEVVNDAVLTRVRGKEKYVFHGEYWAISLSYDPNSITTLPGQIIEEECFDNESLIIYIPKSLYDDWIGELFNNTQNYVSDAKDENKSTYLLEELPPCIFKPSEFCELLQGKYKKMSSPNNGPLPKLNSLLKDPLLSLQPNFSQDFISCLDEEKLVDDYYNLGTKLHGEDKAEFLGQVTSHYFKVHPNLLLYFADDDEFVNIIEFSTPNEDEFPDDKIHYDIELNNDNFTYKSYWSIPYEGPVLDGSDPTSYIYLSENETIKDLDYFDADLNTSPDIELYPVHISKEYNFTNSYGEPIYIDNEFKMAKMPGIYIAYAIAKHNSKESKDNFDDFVDASAIVLSFGELGAVRIASRLAKLRAGLAGAEIVLSTSNILLRNSEWCENADSTFCEEWKRYLQTAQLVLLSGQGSAVLYSKYLKVRALYTNNNKQALQDALTNPNHKQELVAMMGIDLDVLTRLKQTFSEIHSDYPTLLDEFWEVFNPQISKIFELEEAIKAITPVANRKSFFDDLLSSVAPNKLGGEILSLDAGHVKAWKVLLDDADLRKVVGNLEKVDGHLAKNIHTPDELEAAFKVASDKSKWVDDIGYNVLKKASDKVEYINPNGKVIKWTDQHPNNFPNQINTSINSGDAGRVAEGEAAQAILNQKPLESLGLERKLNGQPAAELDIITVDEIVEVKVTISEAKNKFKFVNSNGTPGQIAKVKDPNIDQYVNPRGKAIILHVKQSLPINPNTGTYYASDQAFIDDLLNTHNIQFSNSLSDLTSKLQ